MNFGKQSLAILEAVAPTIATALGGPVAGLAVGQLEKFFGVTGVQLDTAVAGATPDQLANLRKIDNDFKVQMAQIGFEEDKLRYDDTASARSREVQLKDWTPRVLAIFITGGFFGILTVMMSKGVPRESGGDALLVMLGSLGTAWAGVVSYYFGSSAGSARKDQTIAEIAKEP